MAVVIHPSFRSSTYSSWMMHFDNSLSATTYWTWHVLCWVNLCAYFAIKCSTSHEKLVEKSLCIKTIGIGTLTHRRPLQFGSRLTTWISKTDAFTLSGVVTAVGELNTCAH